MKIIDIEEGLNQGQEVTGDIVKAGVEAEVGAEAEAEVEVIIDTKIEIIE